MARPLTREQRAWLADLATLVEGTSGDVALEQDDAENTPGVNPAMQLRWHVCHDKSHGDTPPWTGYADAGFGVLLTAENVPAGGKQFSFTPQFGTGFSYLLDEATDMRLLAGIRWHHTSNANTHENNPGANKIELYAGLNFPF